MEKIKQLINGFKNLSYSQRINQLKDYETYMKEKLYKQLPENYYNTFSVIAKDDPHRKKFEQLFNIINQSQIKDFSDVMAILELDLRQSRSIGCFLGLAIGDALGATTQFLNFNKSGYGIINKGFQDIDLAVKNKCLRARAGQTRIWTDDCSMALTVADAFLLRDYKFDPKLLRALFIVWFQQGLNNGGRQHSIGLGGNISLSFGQFLKYPKQYTAEKDKYTNGNGSLMRLAAIPIAFQKNQKNAMELAYKHSKTTHNGDQAAQCCRLLCLIIIRLINRKQEEDFKKAIEKACDQFQTTNKSVECLAKSLQQSQDIYLWNLQAYGDKFSKFNPSIEERNWNWKDKNFTYSPFRAKKQPDYIGSYCMDALSMALHTVWHTKSFKQCILMNANMGGDCDTIGAIAGQICGAIYGINQEMFQLYRQMDDWRYKRYEVFVKAYKLCHQHKLV